MRLIRREDIEVSQRTRKNGGQNTSLRGPRCILIAGPNGAGKTTFAREFLPAGLGITHFVNADLIAAGLSPIRPEFAAITAGKLFLSELDRLAKARLDFAFESTLSGIALAPRLVRWKQAGYLVHIVFLRLSTPALAIRRVASRVRQGGHHVEKADILRRFKRGLKNFETVYKPVADSWALYDNSGEHPVLIEAQP